MQQLESIYEKKHKNRIFIDRKYKILYDKELIFSPPKSGKSHIIVDFLQNFKKEEYLYIDLSDERIDGFEITTKKLNSFISQNSIKILIVEHYDFSFALPKNLEKIVLTTDKKSAKIEGFVRRVLYPLDFEEFIAFDKRHFDSKTLFSLYTNYGTLPKIVLYPEENHLKELQNTAKEMFEDATEFFIFKRISELQGHKISLYQIYTQLKGKIQISKDKLYRSASRLQERGLVHLVEKYGQPKASKKVFLYDFAIKNALTFKKDFIKRFENMIFLELHKKNLEIFYAEGADFYIPSLKTALLSAPFTPKEIIKNRIKRDMNIYKTLKIETIYIITLDYEEYFKYNDINFEILPYWEWALQL